MVYDAGTIVASATIDTEPFHLALVKMRAEAKDGVKVKADTTDAERKLADTDASLKRIGSSRTSAKVTADTTDAILKLIPLTDKLTQLRERITTARVTADTAEAKGKVDALDLTLRRIGRITARPRVTLDGVEEADIRLDALALRLDRVNSAGRGGGGRGGILGALSGLPNPSSKLLALGAAVPAALPLAGVVAGFGASLLTPLTAATVGLGAFGLAAKSTYTTVAADVTTLTGLQTAYNAATSNKTRAAAHAAELKFWNSLSKPQQQAVTNLHKLSAEWSKFQHALAPEIYPLISGGVGLANSALKALLPTATATGKALDGIERSVTGAFKDPFWHQFFGSFLPGEATKATEAFATSLGNLITGGAHLVRDFAPLGHSFEGGMVRLSKDFENWTTGKGPAQFVAWVHKNSPQITHDVGELASGVTKVAEALVPVGTKVLHDVGAVAGVIGKFAHDDPTVFKDLGIGLLSIGAGLKVIAGAEKAIVVLSALSKFAGVTSGTATLAGTAAEAAGGGVLLNMLGAIGVTTLAGIPIATWIAEQGIAPDIKGAYRAAGGTEYTKSQYFSKFPVVSRLTSSQLFPQTTARDDNPNAQQSLAGNTPTGYDVNKLVASIAGTGNAQELANLAKLAQAYPVVAKAVAQLGSATRAATVPQSQLNRQLGLSDAQSKSTRNSADLLARSLLAQGDPLNKVIKLVDAYVRSLEHVPKFIHTGIYADTAEAHRKLAELLHQRALLGQTQTISEILPGGLRLTRPDPTGNPPAHHKMTAGHPTVTGPYATPQYSARHIPIPGGLPGAGTPSANAPTATTSSSGSSSGGSSGSSGPSSATVGNALASIVNYAGLTFLTGLEGTSKQINSGITTMIDRLNTAVRDHYLTTDKTLIATLRKARAPLEALAAREVITAKALSTAEAALSSLRSQAASTRTGTLSSFQSLGDIGQIAAGTSVAGIISVLGKQDKVGAAFARNLAILRKKGLDDQAYMQLLNEGPATAGQEVAELATATRGQIHRINTDEARLGALGHATGTASSTYLFGARIKAQAADVHALRLEDHRLVTLQTRTAKALEQVVKDGLKDPGTHKGLAALDRRLARTNQLLSQLGGAPKQAAHNRRTKVSR